MSSFGWWKYNQVVCPHQQHAGEYYETLQLNVLMNFNKHFGFHPGIMKMWGARYGKPARMMLSVPFKAYVLAFGTFLPWKQ